MLLFCWQSTRNGDGLRSGLLARRSWTGWWKCIENDNGTTLSHCRRTVCVSLAQWSENGDGGGSIPFPSPEARSSLFTILVVVDRGRLEGGVITGIWMRGTFFYLQLFIANGIKFFIKGVLRSTGKKYYRWRWWLSPTMMLCVLFGLVSSSDWRCIQYIFIYWWLDGPAN